MKPESFGEVYVIHCEGFYKIGRAVRAMGRMRLFACGCPFPLTMAVKTSVRHPLDVEYWLHRQFKDKRKRGEWFLLDDADLLWLRAFAKNEAFGFQLPLNSVPSRAYRARK